MSYCKYCNKDLRPKYQNTYCNNECRVKYTFEYITLPRFYRGEVTTNKTLYGVLSYLYGVICISCGIKDKWNTKPLRLEVDHIDGNSDNNLPNNVRLLCPNCHSQEPTSKGGINNKKSSKRNRYLQQYKQTI